MPERTSVNTEGFAHVNPVPVASRIGRQLVSGVLTGRDLATRQFPESIDEQVRMPELISDGILVATPAGSTAYNYSAQGPIIPITANLLALTPINAFRPRRWRGALLPSSAHITIEVLEDERRPVAAVADHNEVRYVTRVEVLTDKSISIRMLFDPGHSLEERILSEQFGV